MSNMEKNCVVTFDMPSKPSAGANFSSPEFELHETKCSLSVHWSNKCSVRTSQINVTVNMETSNCVSFTLSLINQNDPNLTISRNLHKEKTLKSYVEYAVIELDNFTQISGFIKNNKMMVRISNFKIMTTTPIVPKYVSPVATMFDDKKHSDMTFTIGEKNISVHRCVLVNASEVFAKMMESKDNVILLRDVDYYTIVEMLKLIYSGIYDPKILSNYSGSIKNKKIDFETVPTLETFLSVLKSFQLNDYIKIIENDMMDNLNDFNAYTFYKIGETYNMTELILRTMLYISANKITIENDDKSILTLILKSFKLYKKDNFNCSGDVVTF